MPGRFPLFTDENVDDPIIRGLRQRGWDVQHATKELGEETKDAPLFHLAASLDRVFVSTDKDMLRLAKDWLRAGRAFIYDSETGLYNAKARYFDPKLGRFLTQASFLVSEDPQVAPPYRRGGTELR